VTARSNQSASGSSPSGEEEPDDAAEPHIVSYTWLELATLPDRTDWDRLDRMTDEEIEAAVGDDPDAAPIADESFWKNATVIEPPPRELISVEIDKEVLDWFRSLGGSYDWRINTVLRAFMEQHRDGLSEREAGVPPGLRRFMQDRDRDA
jgi:uncharacterized protein (DUF4415 family)